MEVVIFTISDGIECQERHNNFNCHICQSIYSNYSEVEGHYFTQHKNVIIVLKDGEKVRIRRHFVGPKSKGPKFGVSELPANEKDLKRSPKAVDSVRDMSNGEGVHEGRIEPVQGDMEFDPSLFDDWDFQMFPLPQPSDEILQLLSSTRPEDKVEVGLPFDESEFSFESIQPASEIPDNVTTNGSIGDDVQSQPRWFADENEMNIDIELDEVLEFVLYLQEAASNAASENRIFDLSLI